MTDRTRAIASTILIIANILFVGIMVSVVYLLNWSGPGFALGLFGGAVLYLTYVRIKLGYWI